MVTYVAETEEPETRKGLENVGHKSGLALQKAIGGLKYRNGIPDLCFESLILAALRRIEWKEEKNNDRDQLENSLIYCCIILPVTSAKQVLSIC